jgi:hypothetical protein
MGITKANKAPRIKPPNVSECYLPPEFDGLYYFGSLTMEVDKRLKGNYAMEVFIHEMLHHYCPDWPEKKVDTIGSQMAAILKAHRFVRIESDNESKHDLFKISKKDLNSRRI